MEQNTCMHRDVYPDSSDPGGPTTGKSEAVLIIILELIQGTAHCAAIYSAHVPNATVPSHPIKAGLLVLIIKLSKSL